MADFTDTLKEHIGSMSPDQLAASEARRLNRNASQKARLSIEGRFDGAGEPRIETLSLEIGPGDPIASGGGILTFKGEAGFEETVVLVPAVHRLIAGGIDPSAAGKDHRDRFIIRSNPAGTDYASVDRATLAAMMLAERPVETSRAMRLVSLEPAGVKMPGMIEELISHFTQRWYVDITHAAIEETISKVPSRALHLIVGKDHVSLSVRKEEITTGAAGLFASPLAAAVVLPPGREMRPSVFVLGDADAFRDQDAPFVQNTFGTGPLRRLVLDVAQLKDIICALEPEPQEAALQLLARLVDRAAELNREHVRRPMVPFHPFPSARRARKMILPAAPSKPAPMAEPEIAPEGDTPIALTEETGDQPAMALAADDLDAMPHEPSAEGETVAEMSDIVADDAETEVLGDILPDDEATSSLDDDAMTADVVTAETVAEATDETPAADDEPIAALEISEADLAAVEQIETADHDDIAASDAHAVTAHDEHSPAEDGLEPIEG